MIFQYVPQGICAQRIIVDIEDGVIRDLNIAAVSVILPAPISSAARWKNTKRRTSKEREYGFFCTGQRALFRAQV